MQHFYGDHLNSIEGFRRITLIQIANRWVMRIRSGLNYVRFEVFKVVNVKNAVYSGMWRRVVPVRALQLVVTASVPSSQILFTLLMEAIRSSETLVLARVTRHHITEDGILYRRKNGVFWVVTPCGSCKNRHFGGTWRLLHQSDKNRWRNTKCWYFFAAYVGC
jgi:hypothetical protein